MEKTTRLPESLKNVKFERMDMDIFTITSAAISQRPIRPERIKELYEDWKAELADPLKINILSTGEIHGIDGQHTGTTYKTRVVNGLETSAMYPCIVARDLTPEQEADWFNYEDGKRKSQPASVLTKNHIIAKDPKYVDAIRILGKHGFSLNHSEQPGIKVACVSTIIRIKPELLEQTFTVIERCVDSEQYVLKAKFISGLAKFLGSYSGLDIDHLIKNINKKTPKYIIETSKQYICANEDRVAKVLIEIYNFGLKQDNRINMFW